MVVMAKEAEFSANVYEELTGMKMIGPCVFVTDSKSGIDTIKNAGATKHTVHFERWLHYVRDLYLRGKIKFVLVTDDKMRADYLTKVVDKKKMEFCRRHQMNLLPTT